MVSMDMTRVTVAAVNDYELVVAGVAHLLSQYPDRLEVRDRILIGEPLTGGPVDVALYDTYGHVGPLDATLAPLVNNDEVGAVAIFAIDFDERLQAEARRAGVSGFISKALPGPEIVDAIVAVARGSEVVARTATPLPAHPGLNWPGKAAGLTERESQVLVLVAEGLTNREIADQIHLSAETVKSYLAQVFGKLGFRNRVEASGYVYRSEAFGRHGHDGPPRGPAPG